jgi:hypothetical protein
MSSTHFDSVSGSFSASKCNDGVTSTYITGSVYSICHTAGGDRNAWLLINAGSQSFSRVVVYNQINNGNPSVQTRIDSATLTMFNGATVINPAVTFSSSGSGQATYTFYSIGFLCPLENNCVVISKITASGDEYLNMHEVELYIGTTKLTTSSLTFTMSSTFIDSASKSWLASLCNDGFTSSNDGTSTCITSTGDRNAWLLINA